MTSTSYADSLVPYVRQITDISTSDMSDGKLANFLTFTWDEVMNRISKRERNEYVEFIDKYRKNTVDGTNTTFYTKNSFKRYSGDYNNDMQAVGSNDIEVFIFNPSTLTRTQATVSSFSQDGEIVLSSAPSAGCKLYISYSHLPVKISPLDPLIRDALAFTMASLAYGKLDPQDYESISFRGITVRRSNPLRMNGAYDIWSMRANDKITQINNLQSVFRSEDLERRYKLGIDYTMYTIPPQYYANKSFEGGEY